MVEEDLSFRTDTDRRFSLSVALDRVARTVVLADNESEADVGLANRFLATAVVCTEDGFRCLVFLVIVVVVVTAAVVVAVSTTTAALSLCVLVSVSIRDVSVTALVLFVVFTPTDCFGRDPVVLILTALSLLFLS